MLAAHNLEAIPTSERTLAKRHLSVLTTILYRCLLIGDHKRAERAFACLLRAKGVDIRTIWGVGLGLLVRRRDVSVAVEFLERLILFYPYRPRLHSHHQLLSHPAGEDGGCRGGREKPKRRKAEGGAENRRFILRLALRWRDVAAPVEEEALDATRPGRIKERLEELMLTSTFSDMVGLVCLRGMVSLWLADVEREMGAGGRRAELRREARRDSESVREKGEMVPEGLWEALEEEERDEEMVNL
ncbi:RNA polymerase I-specific initiation factor-domain-containing protein [Sphaerosporella brunnea]|uniref:RNA polymerase I-specific initiation factor-domain-containing protein n=1 Tax=Sphaerosporella brunnea TaxID=1250544 RepID=A0A5J5EE57_9PEZI|nr:RNA polymerase I-specific initiation factor-domain-containing protein [Sphaerosporella brunnea]